MSTSRRPSLNRVSSLSLLSFILSSVAAESYHWPSPLIDQLESIYVEGQVHNGQDFNAQLDSCRLQSTKESTPAQWLRFAYHDMATHNIEDGTGGLDASIQYEMDRDENVGHGIVATLFEVMAGSSKYVSISDTIALGVVAATVECGGPLLPFRGGRIDAHTAGPFGVPEPSGTLESHTESFRRQGFNQEEMIGLVACGHTIGGVHNTDFPNIVPEPSDPVTHAPVIKTFDTTVDFDNAVITEYLDGTTKNPLVIHPNANITSDGRIFGSDGNVTMKRLASPDVFAKTCSDLLTRMIDTVPKGVKLTEQIKPIQNKVSQVRLEVGESGLSFNASFRILNSNPKRTVKMHWAEKDGKRCDTCSAPPAEVVDVKSVPITRLGLSPQRYIFRQTLDAAKSISKFWFEVDEQDGQGSKIVDNDGTGYVVSQDVVLYAPQYTFRDEEGIHLTAAVRNDAKPSRVFFNAYQNTTILTATVDLQINKSIPSRLGYDFYSAIYFSGDFTFDLDAVVNGETLMQDEQDTSSIPF